MASCPLHQQTFPRFAEKGLVKMSKHVSWYSALRLVRLSGVSIQNTLFGLLRAGRRAVPKDGKMKNGLSCAHLEYYVQSCLLFAFHAAFSGMCFLSEASQVVRCHAVSVGNSINSTYTAIYFFHFTTTISKRPYHTPSQKCHIIRTIS